MRAAAPLHCASMLRRSVVGPWFGQFYSMAEAPEMISMSSVVMTAWRDRL